MTEIDVDMAIHAMSEAVEGLLAAVRDKHGREHVAANRQRLVEEVGRLYDSLNVPGDAPAARPSTVSRPRGRSTASVPQRRVA
ncbi:hypothetical protein [Aureimonas leprariae]|uniref:Uncharacterized protein n=1 Tax=Plantimonas leprariae TaxID=2615207 RepID=A0A7V7PQF5_9HYPH|nr:hypothetical protein [Aureimonas leprariae]KAB0680392.1 hypothetical protein F6X38_09505 [Aureimonas leprariae]